MTTLLPADDVLLRGYCGPCDMLGLHLRRPDEWVTTAYGNGGMANGADHARLRLNCALPAVRDHVARLMAASGAPIWHLLDTHGSKLTAAQSAVLVSWSYRSWRRGGPVLRGVLAPYYDAIDNGWGRVDLVGAGVSVGVFPHVRENGQGWYVAFHGTDDTPDVDVSGPETGPEARARADAAALAHNFAYLDGDTVVTPPEPA
jgi:hypothetical protein